MMFLLDCSPAEYPKRAADLACDTGQLLTPLTRHAFADGCKFGIDNGAFSKFNRDGFSTLLERAKPHKANCLFVASPDVVGNARRTLEIFDALYGSLSAWPIALVLQDGVENMRIPWGDIAALFVGGSTEFKLSKAAADCVRAGKILGKWIHVGRVNTPDRFEYFDELGADSCDGTGISRYTHMRKKIGTEHLFSGG
jgi:hypothetical protein